MNTQQNIQLLLQDKPAVCDLFAKFNQAGVRWAIYAGCEVALLSANRVPTDIDIIVHDDDFEVVVGLVPDMKRYEDERERIVTTEGQELGFVCSGLVGSVEGTDIDIMARAAFEIGSVTYPIRLTNYAAAHRLQYGDSPVFLANPFDTILIKAFMRRGLEQNKFDLPDAQALSGVVEIDAAYKKQRLLEVGSTKEVLAFLSQVGA